MILTPYSRGFKTTVGKNSFPLEVMLCAEGGMAGFQSHYSVNSDGVTVHQEGWSWRLFLLSILR